jgi:tRNA A-37 threonylcarbamoyl transferase component Bud32
VAENQPAPVRVRSVRGKRMGRYVLLEHLASGGMAEIFLARLEGESGFAKDLVLKVMQERYAETPQVVKMFLEEARLGAELNHPHIVDVFEIGESDGLRFIAMEYLEGRTLNDVVSRGLEVARPMPRNYAAYVVAQVAEALAYLQAGLPGRGRQTPVVHRDISPPNVIVGYAGGTKLIDFGIARRADARPDEEAGLRPGKVSYMSPEQVRGEPLDGRSDIFSLGTILYEITLGRRLWRGPPPQVMQRIVEETPPPPSYVDRAYPPALERIVMRALEKRPGDRYRDAAEMMLELDRFLEQGERVTNRHLATHLQALWAEDVVVSAGGVRQARAFDDDEGPADADAGGIDSPLDFDRPLGGAAAGAELAHALRDTHPIELAMGLGRTSQQEPVPVSSPAAAAVQRAMPAAPQVWTADGNVGTMGTAPDRAPVSLQPGGGGAPGYSWPRILLVAAVLAGVVAGALVVLLRA